jgi:Dolichyl-phosphate-mannose-protein mannosyltransferase
MGMDPDKSTPTLSAPAEISSIWGWFTALAALVGLLLLIDASRASSATYDEVTYLKVAASWWRTGDQSEITRMGSPLMFWKLQQAPVLWLLDRTSRSAWIDNPVEHQQELLPLVRLGSLWIWLAAFTITICWSRQSYGPRAMTLAAWLFALSPNLIAHGALATMELPLVAATVATFWLFCRFLETDRILYFWTTAVMSGLAFSCKFTAILIPPILAITWWIAYLRRKEDYLCIFTRHVALSMAGFVLMMMLSNAALTGFVCLPLSRSHGHHPTLERWFGISGNNISVLLYETPLPQDWVGFANQMHHQASGGPSYLFGERRMTGWWYYYLIALAVKVPLAMWLLIAARLVFSQRSTFKRAAEICNATLPLVVLLYVGITAVGSSRNYGVRYLLPLAPLAIVWISAVGEQCVAYSWRFALLAQCSILTGITGYVVALAGSHPYELSYFNALGGGSQGGRFILADSNLDWGQGLKCLARLQRSHPVLADMTFYYFGDTEPAHYGVSGTSHTVNATDDHSNLPSLYSVKTSYLAVSASLQWGAWGPPRFFRALDHLAPIRLTDDTTIAIYRTADLNRVIKAQALSGQSDVVR